MSSTPPHAGLRTCVGCRERAEPTSLLRVVVVDGVVVVDADRIRPGRGAWVHARPGCIELAVRRRAFTRAFRTTGAVDVDPLAEHVLDLR